jgi:hypothetical protein
MKKNNFNCCIVQSAKRALLFLLVVFTMASCGFQGRKYTKGIFLSRSVAHPSESIQSKANLSYSELALLEGADEISLTLIPFIKSDSLNSAISNAVQSIRPIQASNSISISNVNIENDTLKIPLGGRAKQRIKDERINEIRSDTTRVKEIIDLNKNFNRSGFLLLGSVVCFTLSVLNTDQNLHLYVLTIIASIIGIIALSYNFAITFILGRKLRSYRENNHYNEWVEFLQGKVLLMKIFIYFPLILIGLLILGILIAFATGHIGR